MKKIMSLLIVVFMFQANVWAQEVKVILPSGESVTTYPDGHNILSKEDLRNLNAKQALLLAHIIEASKMFVSDDELLDKANTDKNFNYEAEKAWNDHWYKQYNAELVEYLWLEVQRLDSYVGELEKKLDKQKELENRIKYLEESD